MEDFNQDIKKAAVKKLLNTDPLSEAEKITGFSYKEDKATESLGFQIQIQKSKDTNKLLQELDDTCFSETAKEYLRKVKSFGFEIVLQIPFTGSEGQPENLYILFHKRLSILLVFDTFTYIDDGSWAKSGKKVPPPSRNGGKFYYNWFVKTAGKKKGLTSSGSFFKDNDKDRFIAMFDSEFNIVDQSNLDIPADIEWSFNPDNWEEYKKNQQEIGKSIEKLNFYNLWVGDHDCREALKMNITYMIENGKFLTKWKERPFLWLLHYGDKEVKGYDYQKINEERIAMLPDYVRDAITPDSK